MRLSIDRLPLYQVDGKLFLRDEYVRWYVATHSRGKIYNDPDQATLPVFYQILFDKFLSMYYRLGDADATYESIAFDAFKVTQECILAYLLHKYFDLTIKRCV